MWSNIGLLDRPVAPWSVDLDHAGDPVPIDIVSVTELTAALAVAPLPERSSAAAAALAAAAAEVAAATDRYWPFDPDDAPGVSRRLLAQVARTDPATAGPHCARALRLLTQGPRGQPRQ